jgi:hypothetical protein
MEKLSRNFENAISQDLIIYAFVKDKLLKKKG